MSNGEDGDETEAAESTPDVDLDAIADDLDDAEAALEDAETAADLDAVAETLDAADAALEGAPEDDEDADELRERASALRDDLEAERGPYASDVSEIVDGAATTLAESDWTEDGELEAIPATQEFLDTAGSELVEDFEADSDSIDALADSLERVSVVLTDTALDPDEDTETIETLLEAAETLETKLEEAEEWSDLTVREQLDQHGFYDVLTPENHKDYPPEWGAIKLHEQRYREGETEAVEQILRGLEKFESDFMVENALDSLERIAPPEAFDALLERAEKRDQHPIRILGRIGDERALDTLQEFLDGGDVPLQQTTLRAIGAIGSEESTQAVADKLVADEPGVRSTAARALGLIGDTRAIDPLADVLAADDADEVRASAAWALNRIGTERAREVASEYADDRAYIVQVEAEKAAPETA